MADTPKLHSVITFCNGTVEPLTFACPLHFAIFARRTKRRNYREQKTYIK